MEEISDAHLPRRQRRFPYQPLNDAEREEIRREVNDILVGINDMLFEIARRIMPAKARKDDLEECVQNVRFRLFCYSIPRYDAQHISRTKVTTFLHKCATWEAIAERKRFLRRYKGEPSQLLDEMHPAPDTSRDRAVESLADRIVQDPQCVGLTPAETRAVKAVIEAGPTTSRQQVSASLGYANQTTLSNTLRRAADRLIDLDIV